MKLTNHVVIVASDHFVNVIKWHLTHTDDYSNDLFCNFELAPLCSTPPGCPTTQQAASSQLFCMPDTSSF